MSTVVNKLQNAMNQANNADPTPTSVNQRALVKSAIKDMVEVLQLIDDHKQTLNDIAKTLKEKAGIKPATSKRAATIQHKANKPEYLQAQQEIQDLLEQINS